MSMNRAEHMAYKISFKWIELISWSRAVRECVCVGGADGRDVSIGQWGASSLLWFIFPQELSKNRQHINHHRTRVRPTLHLLRHPIILCCSFHYCLLTRFSVPASPTLCKKQNPEHSFSIIAHLSDEELDRSALLSHSKFYLVYSAAAALRGFDVPNPSFRLCVL